MGSDILLGSLGVELTQSGVNTILDLLDVTTKVDVPTLKIPKEKGLLGQLIISGSVTLTNIHLAIDGSNGSGTATVSPSFTIKYDPPFGKPPKPTNLDCSIDPPSFGVALSYEETKAFLTLNVDTISVHITRPGWISEVIWKELTKLLGRFEGVIKDAVDAQLKKHPIELVDLTSYSHIPFPKGKILDTALTFEGLGFSDSKLVIGIEVETAGQVALSLA